MLAALLLYGVALRGWNLDARPFWVDEAESSINALTILQHGLPVDHYLGLPLYENMLTRLWPESAEYEFKDSSYSDRGLAIYHGWLPLYVTAASFALAGVRPDDDSANLRVRYSVEEMRRRSAAARAPAVLFGPVFLAVLFFTARRLYGPDAAWAVLAAGAICKPLIHFGRQARYYSAALALSAGCGWMIVLMAQRGRWRDFLLGAILLVLLFHTHVLSFVGLCLVVLGSELRVLTTLLRTRNSELRTRGSRLAVFVGIVGLGVLPWVALTGFAGSVFDIPKARTLLSFGDLWAFLKKLGVFPLLAGLTLVFLAVTGVFRRRLPDRLIRPFTEHWGTFLFLAAWAAAGATVFVLFVPAASYFYGRLLLTVLVPGMLFGALLFAALARAITSRYTALLAPALFVLALLPSGQLCLQPPTEVPGTPSVFDVIESLRVLEPEPGTRLFATPNHHLILMFYTGMPVQSVAAVRKSFLDHYGGELWILEAGPRHEPLTSVEIQQAALAAGHPQSEAEAEELVPLLSTRLVQQDLEGCVASITPSPKPGPDYYKDLLFAQRWKTVQVLAQKVELQGNPVFKGYPLSDYLAWMQLYYYRFVNPEKRIGRNRNYADRIRSAQAFVLPQQWVLYRCPVLTNTARERARSISVCAVMTDRASPPQPGGTRRNFPGSPSLPAAERPRGPEHAGKARERAKTSQRRCTAHFEERLARGPGLSAGPMIVPSAPNVAKPRLISQSGHSDRSEAITPSLR